MINNKIVKNLLDKYGNYKILNIELFNSSQNKVYKVYTDKGILVVKEFSLDAIKNYYYLRKRKEQIRISKILNDRGIKTILPIRGNKHIFVLLNRHYYIVYNYSESKPLEEKEITIEHIKTLACTQSKIHKLKIKSKLTCFYHHVNIDFNKQLDIVKKKDLELYNLLNDNLDKLKELVSICNKSIHIVKNNLCISHNDYKLLNILWDKDDMILIDFDAMGLSNPTCSLCESAYTFCRLNNKINYVYYEEYLKSYLKEYGSIKDDFNSCLHVAMNGKLSWLNYMFSKNSKKKDNYIDGTKSMIKELVLYYDNIKRFNEIYENINK